LSAVNYNPYAPPQAAPPNLAPQQPGLGPPQPWEIGEVLSAAFEGFKANWVVLVFSHLLAMVVAMVPSMAPTIAVLTGAVDMGSTEYWGIYSGSMLVVMLVDAFMYVGLYRISLAVARGQRAEFGALFGGADRFLAMLGTWFLLLCIIVPGYLLLVVPGVILGLGLFMATLFVVDQGMGPVDAVKASWNATQGHKGHLFLFGLVAVLLAIGGYIACFIGIFAVMPLLSVSMAIIYLRVSGRGGPAPVLAGGYGGQPYAAPYGPPPGGYGPPGGGGAPPGG